MNGNRWHEGFPESKNTIERESWKLVRKPCLTPGGVKVRWPDKSYG